MIDEKKIYVYVTATTITDIYYISKKEKGHEKSIEFIANLIDIVEIIGVDKEIILKALNTEMKDFEDSIQISAAEFYEIDSIITRNKKDFIISNLKIYNPKEFIDFFKGSE